jgi:phosphoglycerol transferase MdoB-like AlkP superfamily enzyme
MVIVTCLFVAIIAALIFAARRDATRNMDAYQSAGKNEQQDAEHTYAGNKTVSVRSSVKRKALAIRIISFIILISVTVIFCRAIQDETFQDEHRLYNKLFTPTVMTKYDGTLVTFVMNLKYISVERPAGYDSKEAQEMLASYAEYQGTSDTTGTTDTANTSDKADGTDAAISEYGASDLPNIIVVMNESFSDLSVLGDLETNIDPIPFYHTLSSGYENAITGMAHVSVCGGNTANSEFEFLTGNTMAFLPQGSVPYQQYIRGDTSSIVSYLDSLGYETIAAHPYNATGWDRDKVYPWLGFEKKVFLPDYRYRSVVRDYVSDESCVDEIISTYEEKESGTPLFYFNVTMQNHGGYTDDYDNLPIDVWATGADNESLNRYLSLTKLSDEALEKLVTYFSEEEERTVIVFFGDHQPYDTVTNAVIAQNDGEYSDEELNSRRYEVPYAIWANFDIAEATEADTSLNYLALDVFDAAGIPTDSYMNFLRDLKTAYPVISAQNIDGLEAQSDDTGLLSDYRKLQYYRMFE